MSLVGKLWSVFCSATASTGECESQGWGWARHPGRAQAPAGVQQGHAGMHRNWGWGWPRPGYGAPAVHKSQVHGRPCQVTLQHPLVCLEEGAVGGTEQAAALTSVYRPTPERGLRSPQVRFLEKLSTLEQRNQNHSSNALRALPHTRVPKMTANGHPFSWVLMKFGNKEPSSPSRRPLDIRGKVMNICPILHPPCLYLPTLTGGPHRHIYLSTSQTALYTEQGGR